MNYNGMKRLVYIYQLTLKNMILDYTTGSVNFRDTGAFINMIAQKSVMQEKRLYRGGKTDYCQSEEEIGSPKTIVNLRQGPDKRSFSAERMLHYPIYNSLEKYTTTTQEVRMWMNDIFHTFEDPALPLPLFVHCLSGKDRTGIVVGCLLTILEIPRDIIVEEYLLSDGNVSRELFIKAMEGIGDPQHYFRRINYPQIKTNLIRWFLVKDN